MRPIQSLRHLWLALPFVCAAGPVLANAQDERIRALEQRLEAKLQLIDSLVARVAELEGKAAPAKSTTAAATPSAAPPAAAPATAASVQSLQDTVNQLSESLNRRGGSNGLSLHGFADVGAAWSSRGDPVRLRGFNAGTLDLYLTPQFGERAKALVELAIEYGDHGHVALDLERLQLGYTVSDALTLWLGRFHTPLGLWNTNYHHGANLQSSISRPRFIDFEDKGGVMPVHSVGAWASGKARLGSARLTYDAYVVNGPRVADRTLDFGAYSDGSANKMLGANLGYQPGAALTGLTLGLHGLRATSPAVNSDGLVRAQTRLRMVGAYVGYDAHDWEILGEYYRFANVKLGEHTRHVSHLAFLQVGKTLGAWTPFVRAERTMLDATDDHFRSLAAGRSYRRAAMGLRWALDPSASIKFELSHTRESAAQLLDEDGAATPFAARSYRRAALQYSVAF